MPRVPIQAFWSLSGALFFLCVYQVLWRQFGPWVDAEGFMSALTLPGFEPPPVGHLEYSRNMWVRGLYAAPYAAYAAASTAAGAAAVGVARAFRLNWVGLGAASVAFLMSPWALHWTICLALPLGAQGCFSWGEPIPLLVFFLPKVAPWAALIVGLARVEERVAA